LSIFRYVQHPSNVSIFSSDIFNVRLKDLFWHTSLIAMLSGEKVNAAKADGQGPDIVPSPKRKRSQSLHEVNL
jgi:hypothetical protein